MNKVSVSGYKTYRKPLQAKDFETMFNQTPVLTRVGGACLVFGKFVGLLAIPAIFIPALHSVAIFLVIFWGGLVFTCIALCSYEHFRKKNVATDKDKLELISGLVLENRDLRRQLADKQEEKIDRYVEPDDPLAKPRKVIQMFH